MDRILYNVKKRVFKGVTGDPSWPYPVYEYEHVKSFYSVAPIHIGESFDGMRVVDIDHKEDSTTLIVIE